METQNFRYLNKLNNENLIGNRALLINPPFNTLKFGAEWEGVDSLAAPIGLMYIGNNLIKNNFKVKFLDLNVDRISESQFVNEISNSDFLLLMCFSHTLKNTLEIIKKAKEIKKNIYIICGGPYCKLTRKFVSGSDLTVVGEAEEAIGEILKKIKDNTSLSGIPGLIYKKNNRIIKNNGYLRAENIDNSKNASYILAKNKNYGIIFGTKVKSIAGIMTSRGCPFSCSFCTYNAIDKKIRKRSVDNVIEELKELEKNGTKTVIFYDDNFLVDKKRVIAILDRMIREKIKLKMIVQGRVDSADYSYYKKLQKAGVIMILYGIENTNQDVLDFYNKKINIEQIKSAIELANKAGIITIGYLIIGSPLETRKHFDNMKNFIKSVPLDMIYVSILEYSEGSLLWENAVKQGKISKKEVSVFSNEKLSNHSFDEWQKMRENLTKDFNRNYSRVPRIFYKSVKSGILSLFIKLVLNETKSYIHKRKLNPFFVDKPEGIVKVKN